MTDAEKRRADLDDIAGRIAEYIDDMTQGAGARATVSEVNQSLSKFGLVLMADDPEHKRVCTVLDDVAEANDARYEEWLKTRKPGDTDPRIENSGKPLRIRGMIEDGKLYEPGEDQ